MISGAMYYNDFVSVPNLSFVESYLGCSTQGVRSIANKFRETEVRDFQIAIGGEENILRLEIAIDDVYVRREQRFDLRAKRESLTEEMQVFECERHLSGVEACLILGIFAHAPRNETNVSQLV